MSFSYNLDSLNRVLKWCRNSSFYRDRLPDGPLSSPEELKSIPLTTKEDLRKHSPFDLICVPDRELYQYHESFGTTGEPVSTWLTREDVRDNAREIALCGVGFNEDDTVLIRFPYAISAVAHMFHSAAQLKKACVVPAGARTNISPFPRVVGLLKKLKVTVLACLPLQAVLIAEAAKMKGMEPRGDFPYLRAICTAGEPLSPGRRRLLENIWGVPVFDIYGMAEIGTAVVDCEFGRSHPLEDYFVFELLDEDLKREVRPGKTGNLVITTLKKRAAPLIRYLTGDMARIVENECACGKEFLLEIRGRKKDVITVGGRVFDMRDLEDIVAELPCRTFWVVGPLPGGEGLHFVVENENEDGKDEIIFNPSPLERQYRIKIMVEQVPRGTLYDRGELLAVSPVGKPQYIYSAFAMENKEHFKSPKI